MSRHARCQPGSSVEVFSIMYVYHCIVAGMAMRSIVEYRMGDWHLVYSNRVSPSASTKTSRCTLGRVPAAVSPNGSVPC